MPRLFTWRTLSVLPFFSSKSALRGLGVIDNGGYLFIAVMKILDI